MGLKDLFKKDKGKKEEVKEEKKVQEKPIIKAKKEPDLSNLKEKKLNKNLFSVLLKPIITEKTSELISLNQYVFKVSKRANKEQVRRAIEHLYKVKVEKVRIINRKRKKKNLGKYQGWKPSFKKAIISLKEGDRIEIMPQ